MIRRPPRSPLFPSTPLSRSQQAVEMIKAEPACSYHRTTKSFRHICWGATRWSWPTCDVDRKSTRLNSSHSQISYAVFCLKKKKNKHAVTPMDIIIRLHAHAHSIEHSVLEEPELTPI